MSGGFLDQPERKSRINLLRVYAYSSKRSSQRGPVIGKILIRFFESLKVNDPKAQFRSNVMAELSRASRSLAQLHKSDESTRRLFTQQVWSSASERKRFPRVTSQLDRLLACSSSSRFCFVSLPKQCLCVYEWLSFLSRAGEESKKQQHEVEARRWRKMLFVEVPLILQIPPTFFVRRQFHHIASDLCSRPN